MNAQPHILLVEDDPAIAEPLHYALSREGWQVTWLTTGQAALQALSTQTFDALILDVGLPDMNGFDLCRQIRQHYTTPLLFLTARNDQIDRIVGLEIGADDYCAKPFSPREIISRINAIWRRMQTPVALSNVRSVSTSTASSIAISTTAASPTAAPTDSLNPCALQDQAIAWGAWHFDPALCQVHYQRQPLTLTPYELRLLLVFLNHPERVLSRGQLMAHAWEHPDHSLERTIDSHIKTLRQKLRMIDTEDPIITHRGLGYRLSR